LKDMQQPNHITRSANGNDPNSTVPRPITPRRHNGKPKKGKTYNSPDSLVVTHLATEGPLHCLKRPERTGWLDFSVVWSYVLGIISALVYVVGGYVVAVEISYCQD
jgi:hypothetical protein